MTTETRGPDWRDVFAQDAMNGMVDKISPQNVAKHARAIAIAAYTLADEMLEMRRLKFSRVPPTQPESKSDGE